MKTLCKILVIAFPTVYVFATLYIAYRLFLANTSNNSIQVYKSKEFHITNAPPKPHHPLNVEIWGKAAISMFLWEHILKGQLVEEQGGFVKIGHLSIDDINFTFRWGPGIIQTTVPADTEYLVLILNGRSPEKISTAKQWLQYLIL